MSMKLLTTTILAAGIAFSAPAFADTIKKTVTTTTTTSADADTGLVDVDANVHAEANAGTTVKKSGYIAYDKNGNNVLEPDEFTTYSYNVIDYDGDEYITTEEWDTYTTVWYEPEIVTDTEVREFAKLDANGDGRISLDEYTGNADRHIFTSWDADGNGQIDDDEYKTVVSTYQEIDANGHYNW